MCLLRCLLVPWLGLRPFGFVGGWCGGLASAPSGPLLMRRLVTSRFLTVSLETFRTELAAYKAPKLV